MISVQGLEARKVLVLGFGISGRPTVTALAAGGAEPLVWDDNATAREAAAAEGLSLRDPTRPCAFDDVALLVTSPGIPHLFPAPHPAIAAALAAGVPVDNDIGLFFRSFATDDWDHFGQRPRVVAITGSNGKSTTSALLYHVLTEAGRLAQLAGNIGRGVLDLDPARDGEIVVLELSSFHTELARTLTPDIAVFTNLSPDHLDRHGGIGGYFAAKTRLFTLGGFDCAVIGVDDGEGRFLAGQLSEGPRDERVIRFSSAQKLEGPGRAVFALKGRLSEWRNGRQVASVDLREIPGLTGAHNHQNACAVYAAARELGLGPHQIDAGFRTYPGLPHRCQRIAETGGVTYVDDSKATNAHSAACALQAFSRIRWICGGLEKEGGLAVLVPLLGSVVKAYVIGREADRFARQLPGIQIEICTTMARAVARAMEEAEAGETVLLSPAAASFDQYDNFERRGENFAAEVRARLGA